MVYRANIDQKLCFVLMPFKQPFDDYYKQIIRPAVRELGLDPLRSDEIYGTAPIIQDIWTHIWKSRVIVADVTDKNPNVNYELGLCHSLGVPTVIISKREQDVPFDYRHIRCIIYHTEDPGWDDKLREDLKKTINTLFTNSHTGSELAWPYDTYVLKETQSPAILITSDEPQKIVLRGARLVSDAVSGAFGPHGIYVASSGGVGISRPRHRGVQIAQTTRSANPLEERGIEQMCLVASEVANSSGDGTKLAVLLSNALLEHGYEVLTLGHAVRDVVQGMERAVERVIGFLAAAAKPAKGEDVLRVASTAAGDLRVGLLVTEGFKKSGKDGMMTLIESNQPETTIEFQEGLHFDSGYLSELFVTDVGKLECVLENCYVLVHERKISSMRDLLPLLEQVARKGRALLIIAQDVEGEALATLTVNKMKGTLACSAVKAPGQGDRRRAMLEDIAVVTGGKAITEDLGSALSGLKLDDLGTAGRVTITKDNTTIIGGSGSPQSIAERVKSIRLQIDLTISAYDQEKLRERLATLAGCIATIRLGGFTELDISQERYKVESALWSSHSAIEEGWLPGGAVTLLRAGDGLSEWAGENEVETAARSAVSVALEHPIRRLIENSKRSPTQLLIEIRKAASPSVGFNAESGKVEDLVEAGILDPAKTLRLALRIAFSHAKAVLQTGTWDLSDPTDIKPAGLLDKGRLR